MKTCTATLFAFGMCAVAAHGAGLDRSGQSVSAIFAESGATNLSFGRVMPDVTGSDAGGNQYDVGDSYTQVSLSYTRELTEKFGFAVVLDQPYGANITYNNSPLTSTLGGTRADLSSEGLTIVGKYQVADRVSVFGGVTFQQVRAEVDLNGTSYRSAISVAAVARGAGVDSATLGAALLGDPTAVAALGGPAVVGPLGAQVTATAGAFAAAGGYQFKMDPDPNPGFLIGAAYEIPDIALRFAATYRFAIDNTSDTTESLAGTTLASTVDYKTPQSLNLEFQTGIAQDTLLTASYRWSDFSEVDVVPTLLGSDLVNLDDGHRVTVGIARRFNENLVGSVSIQWEPEDSDDLVSPLGPTNGLWGISVGGRYSKDNLNISGGVNYSILGDARPEVGNTAQATFTNNTAVSVGLRAELTF